MTPNGAALGRDVTRRLDDVTAPARFARGVQNPAAAVRRVPGFRQDEFQAHPPCSNSSARRPPLTPRHRPARPDHPAGPSLGHLTQTPSRRATTAPSRGAISREIPGGQLGRGWPVIGMFLFGCLRAAQDMKQMKPGCRPDDPRCCDQMELGLQHV